MVQLTLKRRVLYVRRFIPVLIAVFGVFSLLFVNLHTPKTAYAAASTVNFQARLQSNTGAIVPDGNYNVEFKLYSASTGGSALWTEDYTSTSGPGSTDVRLQVKDGYLSTPLGSITSFPSTIDWSQQLYLTMNIGGVGTTASWDGEMSPRLALTSSTYAFMAGSAANAGQLSNVTSGNTSTLTFQGSSSGTQNFVIQDQGAAGTYDLLTSSQANADYVALQGSSPVAQTGNIDIAGAMTLRVTSAAAFEIQDSSSNSLFAVNTSGDCINIGVGSDCVGHGNTLDVNSSIIGGGGIQGENNTNYGAGVIGLSSGNNANGVYGQADAATANGVFGNSSAGNGVFGYSSTGSGIEGHSASGVAVEGWSSGAATAIQGSSTTGISGYFQGGASDAATTLASQQNGSSTALLFAAEDSNNHVVFSTDANGVVDAGYNTSLIHPAQLYVTNTNSASRAMILQGASGQSVDILDIYNSAGQFVSGYDASGNQYLNGSLQTGTTSAAGSVVLKDGTANNYGVTLTSPALSNSYTLNLPATGATGSQCLQSTSGSTTSSTSLQFGSCLGSSGVTAATYGSATQVAQFTVNAQGVITAASNVTITGFVGTTASFGGDVSGTYNNLTVAKIQNTPVTITSLANTNFLVYNGTAWVNKSFSGDITVANTGAATIANGAVTSAKILDGTVTGTDIAGTTITNSNLASGAYGAITSANSMTSASSLATVGALIGGSINWTGNIATSGNISTSSTGTITSAGLLTGSAGMTVTGAAINLNASSNFAINIGTGTDSATVTIGNSANAVAINGGTITVGTTSSAVTIGATSGTVKLGNTTTNGIVTTTGGNGTLGVTSTLGIANGGTNTTATPTQGGIAYGTGTAYAFTAAGTSGQVLVSAGTGTPTFSGTASGLTSAANLATVGALASGSIASGFGAISTSNTIATTSSIQGNSVTATGIFATQEGTTFTTAGASTNAALNGVSAYLLNTSGAAQVIQGITAGVNGQNLTLTNTNASNNVTLANNSASATGAKIITGTGSDYVLSPGASASLIYDSANSVWRVIGTTAVTAVTTVGAISATSNANGATITGNTINLAVADGTNGGVVSNTTQTLAGAKTFSSLLTGSAGLTVSGAAINLNASSNFAVNIGTGTSTGAIAIGNSSSTSTTIDGATLNIGASNAAHTINIGTGTGAQGIGIGNNNASTVITSTAGAMTILQNNSCVNIGSSASCTGNNVATFNSNGHLAIKDTSFTGAGSDNVASFITSSALQTSSSVLNVADTAALTTGGGSISGNLVNVGRALTTNITGGGTNTPTKDNSASFWQPTSSPWTYSYTVNPGHSDYYLMVSLFDVSTLGDAPTSVTYGGVSMTLATSEAVGGSGANDLYLYVLKAPAVGTNNLVITRTQNDTTYEVDATSWYDVNQTTPYGTASIATGGSSPAMPSVAATSVSGRVVVDNAFMEVDGASPIICPSAAPASGQTSIVNNCNDVYQADNGTVGYTLGVSSKTASGSSTTMSWAATNGGGVGAWWGTIAVDLIGDSSATESVTAPVASFSNSCTFTAGSCTDASSVMQLQQQYSGATGAVLDIQNSGSGYGLLVESGGAKITGAAVFASSSNSSTITMAATSSGSFNITVPGGSTNLPKLDYAAHFQQTTQASPWNSTYNVNGASNPNGNTDTYLLVALVDHNANPTPPCDNTPSVSFNGVNLNLIGTSTYGAGRDSCYRLYGLAGASGSHAIAVTSGSPTSSWFDMSVTSWYNVNQSTPYGTFQAAGGGLTQGPAVSYNWPAGRVVVDNESTYIYSYSTINTTYCQMGPNAPQKLAAVGGASSYACTMGDQNYDFDATGASYAVSTGNNMTMAWTASGLNEAGYISDGSGKDDVAGTWSTGAVDLIGDSGGTATFGDVGTGGTAGSSDNQVWECSPYTATATGTVSSLTEQFVNIDTAATGANASYPAKDAEGALYSNRDVSNQSVGMPGSLMASSGIVALASGANTFSLGGSPQVYAGTLYWMCFASNTTSTSLNNPKLDNNSTVPYATVGIGSGSWAFGSWPSSLSSQTQQFDFPGVGTEIYATVTLNNPSGTAFTLTNTGQVDLQNASDSTSAFQVQNAGGTSIFNVDTAGNQVDIGGTLAGSVVRASDMEYGTDTWTDVITTGAVGYNFSSIYPSGSGVVISIFNITGLPQVEGTIAYIMTTANKATTSSGNDTVQVQINGTQISSVQVLSSAGTGTGIVHKDYTVMYSGGMWHIVGWGPTSSSTTQQTYEAADYAEYIDYSSDTAPQPGDVLTVGDNYTSVKDSSTPYDSHIIGVVSTDPYQVGSADDGHSVVMALTGRAPVKVDLENGPIAAGDPLTSSSTPGVAMKATSPGQIIGTALEPYDGTESSNEINVQLHPGYDNPSPGTIQGNANIGGDLYVGGNAQLAGDLAVAGTTSTQDLHVSGTASLETLTVSGNISADSVTVTGEIRAATLDISGNANFGGNVTINGHFITGGTVPTTAVNASAGNTSTCVVVGDDTSGTITLQSAGTGQAAGQECTVTFNKPFGTAPRVVVSPNDAGSAAMGAFLQSTPSNMALNFTGTPAAGSVYNFNYFAPQ